MVTLIAWALLAQQGTFFARTFSVPTGNNGWEEYTMAADLVVGQEVRQIEKTLVLRREMVRRFSRLYDLVKAGNKKPLRYPWLIDPIELDDRDPLTLLSDVGLVMSTRVGVMAAGGQPAAASGALADAIMFADRASYPGGLNALVCLITFNYSFRELSVLLPKLDVASARKLSATFDRFANGPQPLVETLLMDIDLDSSYVPKWFDEPAEFHDSEYWDVPEGFLTLTKGEKGRYVSLIREKFTKYKEDIKMMIAREERFWSFEPPPDSDPLVSYALDYFSRPLIARIAVRTRTQLRLAALHCRIIEYKRNYNRWPEKLEDLGGREVWYDPASGGPFYYAKLSDQSYILYSLGTPETGRIDLVYRPEFRTVPNE